MTQVNTHSDTESYPKHEYISPEVVWVLKQDLRRVVAMCAQYIICHNLLCVNPLAHTQVYDLRLHLWQSNVTQSPQAIETFYISQVNCH